MKHHKEKRCPFCSEWYVYNRSTHSYCCPNCNRKTNSYLKQIRFQQKELARKIFEMVKNLTEEDILQLRKTEYENTHHCKHCNHIILPNIEPVSTLPAETQTNNDTNIDQRRKRKQH